MLKVWGRPNAYNVQKVLWLLDEISIDYEHINVGSNKGDLITDDFLSMNPNARIPVLKDDDLVVWESNTILRYLASNYANDNFWCNTPSERTYVERWMDWELASLQPDFISLFWEYYRTPKELRNLEKINHYLTRCNKNIDILNKHLKNKKYLSGSQFSIADIAVGTCFFRYFNMGVAVVDFENVNNWYQRLYSRDSYQKIIAVPFDELKGRLEF